jgi:hypothetical protein
MEYFAILIWLSFSDNQNGRVLTTELPDNPNVTVEACIASCQSQNFTVAGLEWSVQCFCGDVLVNGAVTAPGSDCNMGCGGNSTYESILLSSSVC